MSSDLQTLLLGSSDASEAHAKTLAAYDTKIAHLDRLIAVAEIAAKAEREAKADASAPVVQVVAPTAHLWTRPETFRVHHYDPRRKGTWFSFFETLEAAQAFAVGKFVYGKDAVVQSKLAAKVAPEAKTLTVDPPIPSKVVIVGGPRTGKTTLAIRLGAEQSRRVRHTDELIGKFAWGKDSEEVMHWLDEPGEWVIEGVTAVRALRKWMVNNPEGRLDGVLVVYLPIPVVAQTADQASAGKGVRTVWSFIENQLRARGADVRVIGGAS